jgi:hypothetical protein
MSMAQELSYRGLRSERVLKQTKESSRISMQRLGHCGTVVSALDTNYHQGNVYTADAVVDRRIRARYAQSMGFVAVVAVMCSARV